MDQDLWRRIESVFHELADLPSGPEQAARLVALTVGDEDVRCHVQTLLAENASLLGSDAPLHSDPHVGLRLGPFAVGRLVARGGMAAVYEGQRADDAFAQRVAVKIMDLRVADPALVTQFSAERQVLATLEHPSLTRLLDGGVTPLGEPYLVMEYVDGVPVDRYCDAQHLDVASRVRLFLQICEGVAYAHRALVLHRDLKPSNILVMAEGRVKVVDFGTAALLQPDRLATSSVAPLTPAYASPEQLTGRPVGTASDQYSLGLVLYELLTGAAPFADRPSLIAAMERALSGTTTTAAHAVVTHEAAEMRRTSLVRLRRMLAGDLGTVLAKAVSPDAADRFSSVEHFAEDLRRWLDGEPITARPASVAYRSARFLQRHWAAAAVAGTLAAGMVITTGVSVQQASLARIESGKARELNRFLSTMLSSANPSWNGAQVASPDAITVKQVLDGAAIVADQSLRGSSEIEADVRRLLARTYLGMGVNQPALSQIDRARAVYSAAGDSDGVRSMDVLHGTALLQDGAYEPAERVLRGVVDDMRDDWDAVDPEERFIALNELARAVIGQRQADREAAALFDEAVRVADAHGVHAAGAAVALANLGVATAYQGRQDEAQAMFEDARRRMEALRVAPVELGNVYEYLGSMARVSGHTEEAVRYAALAVEQATRRRPKGHEAHAWAWLALGRAYAVAGDLAKAHETLLEAERRMVEARPSGHHDFEGPWTALGVACRERGDLEASRRWLEQGRAVITPHPGLSGRIGENALELGLTLEALGRRAEARALAVEAHAAFARMYGDAHRATIRARSLIERLDAAR